MKTHTFEKKSSGGVYDQSQYDDKISSGDVLVVKSEKIVGILLSAWPTAVTKEHGKLHCKNPGATWVKLCRQFGDKQDYYLSYIEACKVAKELGYELEEPDDETTQQANLQSDAKGA